MAFFHGGTPGLRVGDRVLPPLSTGAPSAADYGAGHVCRRDRVYLGSTPAVAVIYAAMHPTHAGVVYEVVPDGPVEPDPDWIGEPGMSVQAPAATIIRVIDPESVIVDGTVAELRARLLADVLADKPARVGRNDRCPCGSGVKFKRCCGR
jgi:hypothetical protein